MHLLESTFYKYPSSEYKKYTEKKADRLNLISSQGRSRYTIWTTVTHLSSSLLIFVTSHFMKKWLEA